MLNQIDQVGSDTVGVEDEAIECRMSYRYRSKEGDGKKKAWKGRSRTHDSRTGDDWMCADKHKLT